VNRIVLTGASGRVGTAITERLHEQYDWTYLDREPHPEYDTEIADVTDEPALRDAFEGHDAVVHLAGDPGRPGTWPSVLLNNVIGTQTVLEAASATGIDHVVFASTNHVVGGWEDAHGEDLYAGTLTIDHETPVRPDSFYGASKAMGEDLGRFYVDQRDYPNRFHALRIGYVLDAAYDHPYGHLEEQRDDGDVDLEPGTAAYERRARRTKAIWLSRRDCAHLVDCSLRSTAPDFGVYYGVSDNASRWFDVENAREQLDYDPVDDSAEWDGPP
jgi:NAD+ dependent glucose-6-phosphate dehydrogenase